MKKITVSALSLAAVLAAGSAFAVEGTAPAAASTAIPAQAAAPHGPMGGQIGGGQGGNPIMGHMFQENDTNKDGFISKDEWKAKGEKMFTEIDANKDGKVSQDELKAHREQKREEWKERREERQDNLGQHREEHRGNPVGGPAAGSPAPATPVAPAVTH